MEVANHPDVAHLSLQSVRRWKMRFQNVGYDGLKTRPKSGRPKVIEDEERLLILATVMARPFDAVKEIVQELTPQLQPNMRSIYRR